MFTDLMLVTVKDQEVQTNGRILLCFWRSARRQKASRLDDCKCTRMQTCAMQCMV